MQSELSCADFFEPIHTLVMPTGIPDPCPDFESRVMPSRLERLCRREEETPEQILFRAVFMAHCSEDKGLFDTMDGVLRANERLASRGSRVRVFLSVFGKFPTDEERQRYEKLSSVPEFEGLIEHTPFVTGEEKAKVFLEADVLLFPSNYASRGDPDSDFGCTCVGLTGGLHQVERYSGTGP